MTIFRFSMFALFAVSACDFPTGPASKPTKPIMLTSSDGKKLTLSEAVRLESEKPNTANVLFSDFLVVGKADWVPEHDPVRHDVFRPYTIGVQDDARDVYAELPEEAGIGAVSLESDPTFRARCKGFSAFEPDSQSEERASATFHGCELVLTLGQIAK